MAALDQFASIFGTDDAPDWETLKRRRELARALAMRDSKHSHPLVQGFSDLGSGVGSLLGELRLSAAEKKFAARENATDIPRGGTRAPTPVRPPAAAPAQPPVTAAPPPTAAPGPQTAVDPMLNPQSFDPNVDVVAEGDFNRLDAAAAPAAQPDAPALSWATEPQGFPQQRFDAAFAPTNAAVEAPVTKGDRLPVGNSNQQVAERFPNEVPPAQDPQGVFAPPTATEPAAATTPTAPIRNPAPLADPSRIDPRLAAAIDRHGGPYKDYLTQLAIKEANGKLDVVSKTGAAGPFQFTKGAAKQFELNNRFDPDESVKAAVRYTDRSANQLADNGQPVTYSNFALMHQQGHTGGMNLLTGRPVSPRNLAVNNIDPRSSPDAARERVYKYYAYDDDAPAQTAQPAASPYQAAAVRPDPARSDLQQNVALDPQMMAEQEALPTGQPVQTADSEQGSREMIAAALAGQQRPQGVQLASSDPARLGGITMPRAEPMGRLPLQQSMQNPAPPQAPRPPEISPDMLNSGASFLPGGGGMDVPDMSGPPPDPAQFQDPFAIPFNGASAPPAADAPAQAGAPVEPPAPSLLAGAVAPDLGAGDQPPAVPVAPDVPAAPAPSEAPVRMAQALTPGAASDVGSSLIGSAANVPPVIAQQQQSPVSPIATAPVPSYVDEAIPEVRPAPQRPAPIMPSDTERQLIKLATSPLLSPNKKAQAAAELRLEQERRTLDQAQQDADYTSALTQHVEEKKNRREWLEGKTTRDLTNMKAAAEIAMQQATLQQQPQIVEKRAAEIADLQATIDKKQAETLETRGKILQQPYELQKKGADARAAETTADKLAREEAEERELRRKWGTGGPGGGPLPPEFIRKDIDVSQAKAASAAKALETSAELRKILTDNQIITGFGANVRIDYNRARAIMGDAVGGKKASDSQVYQALIQPIVAYIIKDTVGGSQVSNTDREFAQQASGADLSAQPETLRRLLEIRDRGARENIEKHGVLMNVAVGKPGSSEGSTNWHQYKGVTMPTIPIPEQAIRVLRANDTKAQRENFNFRYGFGEDVASRVLQPPGGR